MTIAQGDGVEERLCAFIGTVEPGAADIRVEVLHRSEVGYSRENWLFDAEWTVDGVRRRQPLIMRRDPAGSVLLTDREVEFATLRALEATTIPAPVARWLDADGKWFERPSLVMDRIEGECRLLAIEELSPLDARLRLARDCLELLASLHRLDWRALGLDGILRGGDGGGAAMEVAYWSDQLLQQQLEPDPRLWELSAWLSEHAPEPAELTLVHGDFKPGNMLLRDGQIVALLDWETAHIGDPVEDIGWVTNPLRHREHQIPGHWEVEQIADRWSELTGFPIDQAALRFWNVLANFKLCVIVITGIRSYAEGRSDRPFDHPTPLIDLAFRLIQGG